MIWIWVNYYLQLISNYLILILMKKNIILFKCFLVVKKEDFFTHYLNKTWITLVVNFLSLKNRTYLSCFKLVSFL